MPKSTALILDVHPWYNKTRNNHFEEVILITSDTTSVLVKSMFYVFLDVYLSDLTLIPGLDHTYRLKTFNTNAPALLELQ